MSVVHHALRPVPAAILGGAVAGVGLDLALSPAEPAQLVTALAAGCGLLVWLVRVRRGHRARRDWRVLQLALILNLCVFALMRERQSVVLAVGALLGLGGVLVMVFLRLRDGR